MPIKPQPDPTSVRKVTRMYYQLKRDNSYSKQITMVSGSPAYLCEYVGTSPDTVASHGNCDFSGIEYIRTHPQVQAQIKAHCKTSKSKPIAIYTEMVANAEYKMECPHNVISDKV